MNSTLAINNIFQSIQKQIILNLKPRERERERERERDLFGREE
jgi:hypothetical protein